MHLRRLAFTLLVTGVWVFAQSLPGAKLPVDGQGRKGFYTASGFDFTLLMRTGHHDNGELFGLMKDRHDKALAFTDGTPYLCNGTNDAPGSGLDFTSILNDPDGSGKLYMVSQFECPVGAYYMSELKQDENGMLQTVPGTLRYISQKEYHGGWVHCAGSKTPWESHLGSEEYEPDGRIIEQYRNEDGTTGFGSFDEAAKYFGGDFKAANPYYWGWVTEVKIEAGEPDYWKHYALGRFSHELAYVMPDGKTVYMSDDGTNVGFYMFVADRKADLSRGTLYAARWHQTSSDGGGSATLEWINLGHVADKTVREAVDNRPEFSEMFETVPPELGHTCSKGFGAINTVGQTECLKLKTTRYSEAAISRFETRRYAALKGATTEFRKEEGITYDPDRKRLYIGMSSLSHGMLEDDERFDTGGPDHIRLKKNSCGAVYALNVAPNVQKDSDGKVIDSRYVVSDMQTLLAGVPKIYGADSPYAGNECDVDGIANPDNLTYHQGSDILVIGEDSRKHVNNMLWAYHVESGTLRRIATLPEEAEATSPYWVNGINGYDYLTLVVQHPNDDIGESYIGVFGPFKTGAS